MQKKRKNIICLGGGSVVPQVILKPLKEYPVNIISITSMVDNGGSTGQLREDFGTLPSGDIRRHILALSEAPEWKKSLWNFRFGHEVFDGGHTGHSFANVFLTGLEKGFSDYEKVLKYITDFMEVKGSVLPAIIEPTNIHAELENGDIIASEADIDVPKNRDTNLRIKKVFLSPDVNAYGLALDAIQNADTIILGPGDLYSSILPCLLSHGTKEAFQKTKAKKILICNLMNKNGETNNFSVLDFSNEVEKYIGTSLDYVIYNLETMSNERMRAYRKKNTSILDQVHVNVELDKSKFIGAKLSTQDGPIVHDSKKLLEIILSLA